MVLKVLNFPFVFLGRFEGIEGAQIFAFSGLWVDFAGIDAVLSGF